MIINLTKLSRFPKNEALRSKWFTAVCCYDISFNLLKTSLVCKLHFTNNDYHMPITSNSILLDIRCSSINFQR